LHARNPPFPPAFGQRPLSAQERRGLPLSPMSALRWLRTDTGVAFAQRAVVPGRKGERAKLTLRGSSGGRRPPAIRGRSSLLRTKKLNASSVPRWLRQRLSYPVEQIVARVWLSQDKSERFGNVDGPRGNPSCDQNLHAWAILQCPIRQFEAIHALEQIQGPRRVCLAEYRSLPPLWPPRGRDTRNPVRTPPCPFGPAPHLPQKEWFAGER
jgi:hypothetical protein